jgi:hypothetical protein
MIANNYRTTEVLCTCKMRNEIKTKRNEINRNEIHRNETKFTETRRKNRNETKRNNSKWNKTYFNETISWGNTRQKLSEKNRESIVEKFIVFQVIFKKIVLHLAMTNWLIHRLLTAKRHISDIPAILIFAIQGLRSALTHLHPWHR